MGRMTKHRAPSRDLPDAILDGLRRGCAYTGILGTFLLGVHYWGVIERTTPPPTPTYGHTFPIQVIETHR